MSAIHTSTQQHVIILTSGNGNPDLTPVNEMLAKGWRIVQVAAAGHAGGLFSHVFVFEVRY